MTYTSAWSPKKGVVVYRSDAGTEVLREGGTRSWRNNNPGNIQAGSFANSCGAIGSDGRFAIFPDETTGLRAITKLLMSSGYKNLTLKEAIYKYAPSNENDSQAYADAVSRQTGIALNAVIGELTNGQREQIAAAIKVHEGWRVGDEHPKTSAGFMRILDEVEPNSFHSLSLQQASPADQVNAIVSACVDKLSQALSTQVSGDQPRLFFPEGIELIQVTLQGSVGDPKLPSLNASLTVSGLKTAPGNPPSKPLPSGYRESEAVEVEDEFEEDASHSGFADIASFTAQPKPPKAIPADHPFPFAESNTPAANRRWPVLTNHPMRRVVSYRAVDDTIVGSPGRMFLGARNNGARYHVAIDLFAYEDDEVVACEAGKIVAFYPFYPAKNGEMTYALFVEHNDFVINYGEVKAGSQQRYGWHIGDQVTAGQPIARVSATAMTHFETYTRGTARNERWMRGGPRPPHLLNPTTYLLLMAASV